MSIIKFANGRNRGTKALKTGLGYILNPEKTLSNLIGGRGVAVSTAYQDMRTVQRLMGKEEGRAYIHFILSFNEEVYDRQLRQIAEKCTAYFPDNQSVWAVHDNTDYRHIHFMLNAVNVRTGKKFSQSKQQMIRFREYVNHILEGQGITVVGEKPMVETWEYHDDDLEEYGDDYDESTHGYEDSFFDSVDLDESDAILQAEEGDKRLRQVIRFYQGLETSLPDGMDIWEAEEIYGSYCASESWED